MIIEQQTRGTDITTVLCLLPVGFLDGNKLFSHFLAHFLSYLYFQCLHLTLLFDQLFLENFNQVHKLLNVTKSIEK